jgi:DNA-binding transcriptional ArsR family regulator
MATYQADLGAVARERFAAVLLGRDDENTAKLVCALGGGIEQRGPIAAAYDALDRYTGNLVVVCDVTDRGAADADLLERVDALAALRAWPLIVSADRAAIDAVAGACTQANLVHLCEPDPADWIAALIEASSFDQRLDDRSVRESEAARLARLNTEVARIAEVVARLSRGTEQARRAYEAPLRFAAPSVDFAVTGPQVREVIRARRLRDRFFEGGLFEDPAWDMLLDLLAARLERAQVSVSSLCIAAAVPPTTALRWITKLTDAGLLEREADPFDKRRAYLQLSSAAAGAMQRYVAAVREANLPFV